MHRKYTCRHHVQELQNIFLNIKSLRNKWAKNNYWLQAKQGLNAPFKTVTVRYIRLWCAWNRLEIVQWRHLLQIQVISQLMPSRHFLLIQYKLEVLGLKIGQFFTLYHMYYRLRRVQFSNWAEFNPQGVYLKVRICSADLYRDTDSSLNCEDHWTIQELQFCIWEHHEFCFNVDLIKCQ